eukprot:TRINITY_DN33281_c0_g1_i2.p1 TRINITY_DN33281_c0_g1~~TRINITY_DN33281_c0_g1_i2.p1  ORF type:complete len:362 (+),score=47.35 TRINITY_DN33281_c0_g1_i2:66-1088(+)
MESGGEPPGSADGGRLSTLLIATLWVSACLGFLIITVYLCWRHQNVKSQRSLRYRQNPDEREKSAIRNAPSLCNSDDRDAEVRKGGSKLRRVWPETSDLPDKDRYWSKLYEEGDWESTSDEEPEDPETPIRSFSKTSHTSYSSSKPRRSRPGWHNYSSMSWKATSSDALPGRKAKTIPGFPSGPPPRKQPKRRSSCPAPGSKDTPADVFANAFAAEFARTFANIGVSASASKAAARASSRTRSSGKFSAPPRVASGASSPRRGAPGRKPGEAGLAPSPIVSEIIERLGMELDRTQASDLAWRRKHFKKLMLQWHPDKSDEPYAVDVFRYLMSRRSRYLES